MSGLLLTVLATAANAAGEGCMSCHEGIESIRQESSAMMLQIKGIGGACGDPEGCVVCHGGDPSATEAEAAHPGAPDGLKNGNGPQTFYPDPGSVWIADRTCGQCHVN